MRMMDTFVFALSLVAVAIVIVSCILIFRNRRKAHAERDDANIRVEEKRIGELEQKTASVIEEKYQQLEVIERNQLEIDVLGDETLGGNEEDRQHVEKGEPSEVEQVRNIQIKRNNNKTTLLVPPFSIYDETRWFVGSDGRPQVQTSSL